MIKLASALPLGAALVSLTFMQQAAGQQSDDQAVQLDCPAQPEISSPGVYATVIEKRITLSRSGKTLELGPGGARTGFADASRLTCLERVPNFLAISPAPGSVGVTAGCGSFMGGSVVVLPTGSSTLQSPYRRLDWLGLNEIGYFLNSSYPPETVLLHAVSQGMTIDRALYAAINSDPDRANEFYWKAIDLMPNLPGWVCPAVYDSNQYSPIYDVNDIPGQRTVQEVAERFFNNNERMSPFPDWTKKEFNMLVEVDELMGLVGDSFWYRPGPSQSGAGAHPRASILISLYKRGKQILIDADNAILDALKQAGKERVPVTFYYNQKRKTPVSTFGNDVTLNRLFKEFFSNGLEVTQVPFWPAGDYHLNVTPDELLEHFTIPDGQSIDPARYQEALEEMRQIGFNQSPMLITVLREGKLKVLAEPERARVAMDLGKSEIPVVLFYHQLNRQSCSAPTRCFNQISRAWSCATTQAGGGDTGFATAVPPPPPQTGSAGGSTVTPEPPPPPPVSEAAPSG